MWGLRHVAVILVCECVFPQIVQILSKVPEALASGTFPRGSKTSVPRAASRPQIKNCVRNVCCVQSKSGELGVSPDEQLRVLKKLQKSATSGFPSTEMS